MPNRHEKNTYHDDLFYFITRIHGVLNLADFFSNVCKQIWDKQQMNDTADSNLTRQMSFGTNYHRQNLLVLHVPA